MLAALMALKKVAPWDEKRVGCSDDSTVVWREIQRVEQKGAKTAEMMVDKKAVC
jgi:hypothetical protein